MADMNQDAAAAAQAGTLADQAVAQGGAYEVLRKRLSDQGARLRQVVDTLNQRRLQEFGDSRMEVIGRFRIRSENNCVGGRRRGLRRQPGRPEDQLPRPTRLRP
jgi:hypothetical protein